jgi:hypothetical protein
VSDVDGFGNDGFTALGGFGARGQTQFYSNLGIVAALFDAALLYA